MNHEKKNQDPFNFNRKKILRIPREEEIKQMISTNSPSRKVKNHSSNPQKQSSLKLPPLQSRKPKRRSSTDPKDDEYLHTKNAFHKPDTFSPGNLCKVYSDGIIQITIYKTSSPK